MAERAEHADENKSDLDGHHAAEGVNSGPYTRAQFAAAVDEAHADLHEAEVLCPPGHLAGEFGTLECAFSAAIGRAHAALHRVGAGSHRVACATQDPEVQATLRDLLAARDRELPCGHTMADLIGGTEPDGRPCVTKCGACLAARQTEIRIGNRLLRAWRSSGMKLGKLVVLAANEYAVGAAVSLTGFCDEALVEMCERYVAERASSKEADHG